VVDYVFFDKNPNMLVPLHYLSIVFSEAEPPGPGEDVNLVINVTSFSITDATFNLSPSNVTFSQKTLLETGTKEVSVTLSYTNGTFDASSIKWTLDTKKWQGDTLKIDFTNPDYIDYLVIGTYTITIEATLTADKQPYSAALILEISQ